MKKFQITLIIIGFILLALMATNPSIDDHRDGVKKMYKRKLEEINKSGNEDLGTQIGTSLALLIGDGFIDKIVSRENYLLFSLTKVSVGNKSKNIGLGILGQVLVNDYEEISNASDESEIALPASSSNWVGEYNNYDSSLPIYMGFGYCNPGSEDIEIKIVDNTLSVIKINRGVRDGITWSVRNEFKVTESTDSYLIFNPKDSETGSLFEYKLLKIGGRYFVKNLAQKDCDDYEVVKTTF
jgi:hypothetical protein